MSDHILSGFKLDTFDLIDSFAQPVSLSDLLHEKRGLLILQDDLSSADTIDICGRLRDNMKIFRSLNTEVMLISEEPPETLQEFKERYNLNFTLLSDKKRS